MSRTEARRFRMRGTFTGKLATVGKEGGSHVVYSIPDNLLMDKLVIESD